MICEFRNKLERFADILLIGNAEKTNIQKETNIVEVIIYIFLIMFAILFFIPIRILTFKFKCSKYIEE